ncbi:hypothetical protein, partial [Citrobacter freundii]|uniref:hypothetical protein n=1 Tax=Citrobacter freundii TaxID=546 RepID=UPI003B434B7B
VPAYGPQNDVTLKMPAFEWVHVQLHQQKGMISLSPPTICNSAQCASVNGLIPLFRRNPEGDKNVIVQSRDKQRRFFIISHKSGQRDNSIARFLA